MAGRLIINKALRVDPVPVKMLGWCTLLTHRVYINKLLSTRLASGPGLKDFLTATQQQLQAPIDDSRSQEERTPYLLEEDVAAKGRKGNALKYHVLKNHCYNNCIVSMQHWEANLHFTYKLVGKFNN